MSLPLSLRALLLVAGLTAAAAGALIALSRSSTIDESAAPPSIIELALPDMEGRDRAIAEWGGKTLLINFWATWCAPCREEIPLLEAAQAKYVSQGLQVIGVAIDDPTEVAAYQREVRISYPVLLGDFGTLSLTAREGNSAQVLPFTLIVSPDGKVVGKKVGSYTKTELESLLASTFQAR
jgi:thiol-disulfide isomerase/thioredoxin